MLKCLLITVLSVLLTEQRDGYTCQLVEYEAGENRVQSYLLVPDGAGADDPRPGLVLLHDHGARFDIGKEKLVRPMASAPAHIRASARQWVGSGFDGVFLADSLAALGYVVIVPDALYWGGRSSVLAQKWSRMQFGGEASETIREVEKTVYEGQRAIYDKLSRKGVVWAEQTLQEDAAAAKLLAGLPCVDPRRIGCFGWSMGAHRAWLLTAFCPEVSTGVSLCWMTLKSTQGQPPSASDYSMMIPALRDRYDFPDIARWLCPKPFLFLNGTQDKLFPAEAAEEAFRRMQSIYAEESAPGLRTEFFVGGHHCGKAEQARIVRYLDEQLRSLRVEAGDPEETILEKAVHTVPNPRQLHALENGFEAFVHFGPNTFTGREWGSGLEDPAVFRLKEADTDQWCQVIAAAGMKRVLLTAKHHDGFVLWPSQFTTHGVVSSPYRGDIVRSLAESCRKYGLEFGFYLSPADLYQMEAPDGLYGNGSVARLHLIGGCFPALVDDYNAYFMNQLYELLTQYGPVSEIWFDGAHPKHKGGQQYNYLAWKELIHALAPDAVIFGKEELRWCGNEAGETRSSEWNVIPYAQNPADLNMFGDLTAADLGSRARLLSFPQPYWPHYQPAETDVSIRDGWFWRNDDEQRVRPAEEVIDIYERSVGGNSILLLNVPPDTCGRISPRDSAVLLAVGRYLRDTYSADLLSGAQRKTLSDGIEFTLPEEICFDRLNIGEDLSQGERVESFVLEIWADGWQEVARGSNIGYRRILRFPEVSAGRLRIRFLASRAAPHIGYVSAHKAACL